MLLFATSLIFLRGIPHGMSLFRNLNDLESVDMLSLLKLREPCNVSFQPNSRFWNLDSFSFDNNKSSLNCSTHYPKLSPMLFEWLKFPPWLKLLPRL